MLPRSFWMASVSTFPLLSLMILVSLLSILNSAKEPTVSNPQRTGGVQEALLWGIGEDDGEVKAVPKTAGSLQHHNYLCIKLIERLNIGLHTRTKAITDDFHSSHTQIFTMDNLFIDIIHKDKRYAKCRIISKPINPSDFCGIIKIFRLRYMRNLDRSF